MVKPKIEVDEQDVSTPSSKPTSQQILDKFKEEETKLVKGRFRNHECPNSTQVIQCLKYKGVPMFSKAMTDGEMYEVPLWVARWLNGVDVTAAACGGKINSCAYPTHGFKWDPGQPAPASASGADGIAVPIVGIKKWNRRFSFESLEFDVAI